MYAQLMDFQADGGGDGPEAVNEALHAAVHQIRWSQDQGAYQAIFLVGDAQPHMDYPDDVKYPDTIKAANARGIIVNTIQAGDDPATHAEWVQIAQLSQGAHFKVGQQGDAIAVTTPSVLICDAKFALSKDLRMRAVPISEASPDASLTATSTAFMASKTAVSYLPRW